MRKYFSSQLDKGLANKVPATGLGLFRILFCLVLGFEVLDLLIYQELIYNPDPYTVHLDFPFRFLLTIWLGIITLLGIGFKTRYFALINYILTFLTLGSMEYFEYHAFYVYLGLGFLLIFLESEKGLSIDNLIYHYKNPNNEPRHVSIFNYTIPVLIGIATVYFDSVFYKYDAQFWMKGLGMWLPSTLPQISIFEDHFFLNNHLLTQVIGYGTLVFETLFIFLMWFRRTRVFLFIIGIILHTGIILEFPIPWFGLIVCVNYLLLLPPFWVEKIYNKIRIRILFKLSKTKVFEWILALDRIFSLKNIAISKAHQKKLLFLGLTLFTILQMNCLLRSRLVYSWREEMGIPQETILEKIGEPVNFYSKMFFGITKHPVFMDFHFMGYEKIYAISYIDESGSENWLPIIDKDGHPDKYIYGPRWVNWSFRVNSPIFNEANFRKGVQRYTSFWIGKNNIIRDGATFKIHLKKIEFPSDWEEGYMEEQCSKPWKPVGTIIWSERNCQIISDSNFE